MNILVSSNCPTIDTQLLNGFPCWKDHQVTALYGDYYCWEGNQLVAKALEYPSTPSVVNIASNSVEFLPYSTTEAVVVNKDQINSSTPPFRIGDAEITDLIQENLFSTTEHGIIISNSSNQVNIAGYTFTCGTFVPCFVTNNNNPVIQNVSASGECSAYSCLKPF